MISLFLFKENQWSHIYDIMDYYYMISLYIYLKFFILRFYEYIMIIISLITLILQKYSNYYYTIIDFSKYYFILNNILLYIIYILILNLFNIWNMINFFYYQFYQISKKNLIVIILLIYLFSMILTLFSYLLINL